VLLEDPEDDLIELDPVMLAKVDEELALVDDEEDDGIDELEEVKDDDDEEDEEDEEVMTGVAPVIVTSMNGAVGSLSSSFSPMAK